MARSAATLVRKLVSYDRASCYRWQRGCVVSDRRYQLLLTASPVTAELAKMAAAVTPTDRRSV
eukprot:488045-Prymnesium_polylepis.1